jgi:hypothetical protein
MLGQKLMVAGLTAGSVKGVGVYAKATQVARE